MHNEKLRAAVEQIDRDLGRVTELPATDESRATIANLRGAWDELVKLLALGPAPELRDCPTCGRSGMRAASICGYCWTKLAPLSH